MSTEFILWIVYTILGFIAIAIVWGVYADEKSTSSQSPAKTTPWLWTIGIAGIGSLFLFACCIQIVNPRNTGVIKAFGSIIGEEGSGFHLNPPWADVSEMDGTLQVDRYNVDKAIEVKIANQQKAWVNLTLRWRIDPKQAKELYINYKSFDHLRQSLVESDLQKATNTTLNNYNPINSINVSSTASSPGTNVSYASIGDQVKAQLQIYVGNQITINVVNVSNIRFDDSTQARLNDLNQQYAKQRNAIALQATNTALAKANQILAASISKDPNVLVAQCMNDLDDLITKEHKVPPAGFSCWPGGSATPIIANAGGSK